MLPSQHNAAIIHIHQHCNVAVHTMLHHNAVITSMISQCCHHINALQCCCHCSHTAMPPSQHQCHNVASQTMPHHNTAIPEPPHRKSCTYNDANGRITRKTSTTIGRCMMPSQCCCHITTILSQGCHPKSTVAMLLHTKHFHTHNVTVTMMPQWCYHNAAISAL